jgi:hypothetical protein
MPSIMPFQFDAKLDLGHILTLITVLASVLGMLRSWSKDRTLNRQREANQVRLAAAMTLAKLEWAHRVMATTDSD